MNLNNKASAIILMSFLVTVWGGEYTVARTLMDTFSPINILLFKYIVGFAALFCLKRAFVREEKTDRKDYLKFLLVTFFGVVMYFVCDYTAMDYMPVSLVTVVLAFVPVVSILVDRVLYGRKLTGLIILGVAGSVAGVAIVIGTNLDMLRQGGFIGYALAFGAVVSWVIYNFFFEPLSGKYSYITLGYNQVVCALILALPMQLTHLPDLTQFRPGMIVGVLYLGLISCGIGYMILPLGLHHLGATVAGIYSNFLPITSTIFAWIFLGQSLTLMQMAGCAIVIFFSCIVIVEVGKRGEQTSQDQTTGLGNGRQV